MKTEKYTQKELKKLSDAFEIVYNKIMGYPDNYENYLSGWQNKDGSFSYGSYDEGNKQVEIQNQALWNFPIRELSKAERENQ